jgi:hypothetical protein
MTSEITSNTPAAPRQSREERQVTQAVRRESDRAVAPRQRPQNLGGPRLKLNVMGEIPGFHLYWENDDEGAIEQLLYEGFEFVLPEEVRMQSHIVADKDVANRVSRYVGKKADGSPLRAYLMKCSDEIWADRESDRYERANAWDNAIKQGKVQHGDGRYKPKGVDISLDTDFSKSY